MLKQIEVIEKLSARPLLDPDKKMDAVIITRGLKKFSMSMKWEYRLFWDVMQNPSKVPAVYINIIEGCDYQL